MRSAGLLVPFANLFATRLQGLPLSERSQKLAGYAALLSDEYEAAASRLSTSDDPQLVYLSAIAQGQTPPTQSADVAHADALRQAGTCAPKAPTGIADWPSDNRLGEALLATISQFATGADGNTQALAEALSSLRAFGLEDDINSRALIQKIGRASRKERKKI